MKTLRFLFLFLAVGLMISACGDDDPNDGNVDCNDPNSVNMEILDELTAYNNALSAWINDPENMSLCTDYKAAAQDYINALKALEDCASDAGLGNDFRIAIMTAEESLEDLPC
jgi:hypothetical protein